MLEVKDSGAFIAVHRFSLVLLVSSCNHSWSGAFIFFHQQSPFSLSCLFAWLHQTTADQKKKKQSPSHSEPTGGWRPEQAHWLASGLCDALQTEPGLCSLTFPLIGRSVQSNAIINKDHKQVMAFILLKFRVQKRSVCGWQRWLLFGGSFQHSPTAGRGNRGLLVAHCWQN